MLKIATLYTVKNGEKYSAATGTFNVILSMLALPGIRESIVLVRKGTISKLGIELKQKQQNKEGDEYYCKFENFDIILSKIISFKKSTEEDVFQIRCVSERDSTIYQKKREVDAKRILYIGLEE